jgi:hypothetical protein
MRLHLPKGEQNPHVLSAVGDRVEGGEHIEDVLAIHRQKQRLRHAVADLRLHDVRFMLEMTDVLRDLSHAVIVPFEERIEEQRHLVGALLNLVRHVPKRRKGALAEQSKKRSYHHHVHVGCRELSVEFPGVYAWPGLATGRGIAK